MSCDYVNNLKLRGHVTKTIFAHNLSALHFDLCPHIILELQASFFADRFDHFDGKLLYCFLSFYYPVYVTALQGLRVWRFAARGKHGRL